MNKFFAFCLIFYFCGCTSVTPLNYGAESVEIVLQVPQGCQKLGEVEGYKDNAWENLSLKEIKNSARNDLKNNAFAMGADTVVVFGGDNVNSSSSFYSGGQYGGFIATSSKAKEYHIDGIAYKCR